MIYFKQDWYNENGKLRAVPHKETKNQSFVRMVPQLEQMKINNRHFFLALSDPEIANYDPHKLRDPSNELKLRIWNQTKKNIWYYFREVIRVPIVGGDNIPFILNRANLSMTWCYMNNIDYMSIIPRQKGKTVGAICITSHVIYFRGKNIKMGMATKDTKLKEENVDRLKRIRDGLPKWMLELDRNDADNKTGISYKILKNEYQTYTAQKEQQSANNLGRGMSGSTFHIDEPNFFSHIRTTYSAMMGATTAAIKNARERGQPYSNILTTTAGDPSTESGKWGFEMFHKAMAWTEKLYDFKDVDEVREVLDKNSKNRMIQATFSYLQLGETHEWLKDVIIKTQATPSEIDRDFLNIWNSGDDSALISLATLKRIKAGEIPDPVYIQVSNNGYIINWYIPKTVVDSQSFKRTPVIMGMDTAEGVNRDFTCFTIVNPETLEVIATFRCNDHMIPKIGMFLGEFLCDNPNIVFIPERKSTGGAIIDSIIMVMERRGVNPFKRIYNKIVQLKDQKEYKDIDINSIKPDSGQNRKMLGFMTTGDSREILYKDTFQSAISINPEGVHDKTLILEMSGLKVKNGRIDHSAGGHDDMVISYLLACWLVLFGKNVHYYGLDSMSFARITEAKESKDEKSDRVEQEQLRSEVTLLMRKIATARDETIKRKYMADLAKARVFLKDDIVIDPVSIDKLNRTMRETNYAGLKGSPIVTEKTLIDMMTM